MHGRDLARRLDRALPAYLHFDTGMSRLGLDARECAVLAQDHGRLAGIDVRYVMSHLVSAEIPDDQLNAIQRDRFIAGRARLPPAPASLANSSGIFLGDGVRLRPRAARVRALRGQSDAGTEPIRCGPW